MLFFQTFNQNDKRIGIVYKLGGRAVSFIYRSIAFQLRNMTAIKIFIAMSNNAARSDNKERFFLLSLNVMQFTC